MNQSLLMVKTCAQNRSLRADTRVRISAGGERKKDRSCLAAILIRQGSEGGGNAIFREEMGSTPASRK